MNQGSSHGDSSSTDAFGFGGDVTMVTPEGSVTADDTHEGETVTTTPSEGTAEKTEESIPQDTEQPTGESEPTTEDADVSEDSTERRMVIDTIESQLDKFDQGALSAEDLEAFFKENEEIARIANKSKRVKERYRTFKEGKHPRLKETETSTEKLALSEGAPQKEMSETKPEDAPLTAKDLEKFFEQREAAQLERQLKQERRATFETFASSHNVVDEEATALERTANALIQAHEDWSFDQALKAAYRAIGGEIKPKPTQVTSRSLPSEPQSDEESRVDLSEGTWSIPSDAFGMG